MSEYSYSAIVADYFAATSDEQEKLALSAILAAKPVKFQDEFYILSDWESKKVTSAIPDFVPTPDNKGSGNFKSVVELAFQPITLEKTANGDKRNQSFSVSKASLRVKTDFVDKRMLHMRTDADKLAKAASLKRQNNRTPLDALQRIESKIAELISKLEKATRQGKDCTALDALLIRCNYYRHREIVRLAELQVKGDAKDYATAETAIKVEAKRIEFDGLILGNRPVIPASVGRTYKVKRKVLRDRPSTHGDFDATKEADKKRGDQPDHATKRVTGKPVKARKPSHAKRGSGSY